ncbi:aldo/keto reductase [candidate division KSB1 bacterium]|nr:aldo/keto reductase [candidate division KSB1 bacterium]
MEYQRLGSSDLTVSRFTLGCNLIDSYQDGIRDEKCIISTIHKALDLGINFFDTSGLYQDGYAERLLGKALENHRKNVYLSAKVGIRYVNKKFVIDLSKEYIKSEIEESLRRLKVDTIDLYQAHWPDYNTHFSETFEALNKCIEDGKIRYVGVSNFDLQQLKAGCKFSRIIAAQVPLNLLKREYEVQIIPHCYKENIGLIAYNPLAKGLMGEKDIQHEQPVENALNHDPLLNGENSQRLIKVIERLRHFAAIRNRKLSQLAIAWVVSHPAISTIVQECASSNELEENLKAMNWSLSQEELAQIELLLNMN